MDFGSLYRTITCAYAAIPKALFGGYAFPPIHVFIELTRRCNLRCAMCQNLAYMDQLSVREEKERELTLEELKRIIAATPRFSLITFTGGEPLFRDDFADILRHVASARRCHVITNGVLIDKKMAQLMVASAARDLFSRGLVFVGISIHGPAEVHDRITGVQGCFSRVTEAARNLAEAKAAAHSRLPFVYVCVVLTGETVTTLPEMPAIAKAASADVLNVTLQNTSVELSIVSGATMETMFTPPRPPDFINADVLRAKLSETLQRAQQLGIQVRLPRMPMSHVVDYYSGRWNGRGYTCNAPWTKTFISPHGKVYTCHQFEAGSVREKPLKAIWNNAEYRRFRQVLKRHKVFPVCAGCCEIEYASRSADKK
jgi:radical SAM protein with 4Fe4S-binding SPASM domain